LNNLYDKFNASLGLGDVSNDLSDYESIAKIKIARHQHHRLRMAEAQDDGTNHIQVK
jgi:hypothetical protein